MILSVYIRKTEKLTQAIFEWFKRILELGVVLAESQKHTGSILGVLEHIQNKGINTK